MVRHLVGLLMALGAITWAHPGQAAPELVNNGNFDQTTITSSTQITGTAVTGWTNAANAAGTGPGFNVLALPGTADSTGFTTAAGQRVRLTGPGGSLLNLNYAANGMPATSPGGGNLLVASTDTAARSTISQQVGGLTVGQQYNLSFYWAGAQFAGSVATTSEFWSVTFGSDTRTTAVATQALGGFSPWTLATMSFTATATSQTLAFLATSPPNGAAGAALLDTVSLTAAPEPATFAILAIGLATLAAVRSRPRPG